MCKGGSRKMIRAIFTVFFLSVAMIASAATWRFVTNSNLGACYLDSETVKYPNSKKTLGFKTGPDKNYIQCWIKCGSDKRELYLNCVERMYSYYYPFYDKNIPPDSLPEAIYKDLCK